MKRVLLSFGVMLLFVITACSSPLTTGSYSDQSVDGSSDVSSTTSDTLSRLTEDDLTAGGPPKDGIPSIDDPVYISADDADEWIEDNELVLAIEYKGVKRAYPLQILTWHEIVNDDIAGNPILITYCPLCGSGIAYERVLDGEAVEFGTSGKLYNSNLVMYDRKTDSLWTQIDGEAIIGPKTGDVLTPVSLDTVTWKEWFAAHPDTEVLSKKTGFTRNYGADPYSNYFEEDFLMFPVDHQSDKLANKDVVYGITLNGVSKAYPDSAIDSIIQDTVGGVDITVERLVDGRIVIVDSNGTEIVKERDFWFAWHAFHPDTLVYGFNEEIEQTVLASNDLVEDSWRTQTLVDINGDSFSINDFSDTHVYIETFAIWCPTCRKQQEHMSSIHDSFDVQTIALNIDANEDEQQVRSYVEKNGFSSRYVVASESFTSQLISEFGAEIAAAPAAPVIHLCPGGDALLLDRGLKSVIELQEAMHRCEG